MCFLFKIFHNQSLTWETLNRLLRFSPFNGCHVFEYIVLMGLHSSPRSISCRPIYYCFIVFLPIRISMLGRVLLEWSSWNGLRVRDNHEHSFEHKWRMRMLHIYTYRVFDGLLLSNEKKRKLTLGVLFGVFKGESYTSGTRKLAYFLNWIRKNCIYFGWFQKTGI